ncbi:putative ribonuclease H-like domain-containing protein [Tanacetum coccineum]
MGDKKNSVLFTESECLILSPSFKLLDESQVVLRAPRKDDVYSLDLKNIVPCGGFCECTLMVPYRKGKQHKASCKAKLERIIRKPLELLHMDLFGPVSVESINKKRYCLVVTDDFSRLRAWEFKNHAMNEFCAKKGIKREFNVARTLQRNGVAERKNRTLIEAARTMALVTTSKIEILDLLIDQPNVAGTGPNWMFDLDFLTNSMNYVPVSVENHVNMDADAQDSYVAGSLGKDKGPTQEYILLPLQPHRTRILELTAKAMDDVSRQAFDEEKRRIASQKKAAQATSSNQLSTDRPSISTDRSNTPNVSTTSTPTSANAGESSFVYLGGKIPIDASTLPNADLPIDPKFIHGLEDAF